MIKMISCILLVIHLLLMSCIAEDENRLLILPLSIETSGDIEEHETVWNNNLRFDYKTRNSILKNIVIKDGDSLSNDELIAIIIPYACFFYSDHNVLNANIVVYRCNSLIMISFLCDDQSTPTFYIKDSIVQCMTMDNEIID